MIGADRPPCGWSGARWLDRSVWRGEVEWNRKMCGNLANWWRPRWVSGSGAFFGGSKGVKWLKLWKRGIGTHQQQGQNKQWAENRISSIVLTKFHLNVLNSRNTRWITTEIVPNAESWTSSPRLTNKKTKKKVYILALAYRLWTRIRFGLFTNSFLKRNNRFDHGQPRLKSEFVYDSNRIRV